jgi:acyl-CoA hydrolase
VQTGIGTRGQSDFAVGALHSAGGRAIIALPSWYGRSATSTVVGALSMPVTSFQHSFIVTERGCAPIFGRSQREQARAFIEQAAHPDAREWLWEESEALGLALKHGSEHSGPFDSRQEGHHEAMLDADNRH